MNITMLTYGSRGDVQPFLALAVGLQAAGHAVTLAAPHRFTAFIEEHGVHCVPLAGDPDELSLLFNDAGRNVYRMVRSMQEHVYKIAPDVVKGARKALHGADLLVHSFAFTTGGHSFARALGIPDISLQMFPVFAPTRDFPAVGMPDFIPKWLNYFSHWLSTQVFWHGGNAGYYQLRRKSPADFPARLYWPFTPTPDRSVTPLIYACSPTVIPQTAEWSMLNIHVPGYLFLEQPDYQPPDALNHFLETGNPPVCITFGSMVNRDAERIGLTVLEALQCTNKRAIFLTGWGDWQTEPPPDYTLFLDAAPHDWLFPRCEAVIHHGGAGTTAACLRAGVPSIVIPHAADQSFWGSRVSAMGAGPNPIPVNRITSENLTAVLTQAGSDTIRRRAKEVGDQIRSENGVGRIVSLIEEHATVFHQSGR
jgi:sterol 3beta-glucosyltransferase